MKQIYIAIGVLLVSLTLFVYTTNATPALSNGGSPCDKTCGSIAACLTGGTPICGWTNCDINVPGAPGGCSVSGTFCCIN